VAIDYFSNFIAIDLLNKTTSKAVVGVLKKQFTLFGIPSTIVSDGEPQFTGKDFQVFTKKWGITHVRSSPQHPNANGKAESAVKIMKHLILKCERERTCQYEALLEQRNTPRQDTGCSPTEMMFGRKHAH
jgi:transposase InsO family protein